MTWRPSRAQKKQYAITQKEKEFTDRQKNDKLREQDVEAYEKMRLNLPKKPPGKQ